MDVAVLRPPLLAMLAVLAVSIALSRSQSPAPLAPVPAWYGDHTRPPVAITGQVFEGRGDITVAVFPDLVDPEVWSIRLSAAADGSFRTPPLPRGRYIIVVFTSSQTSRAVPVNTFAQPCVVVDVFLQRTYEPEWHTWDPRQWDRNDLGPGLEQGYFLLGRTHAVPGSLFSVRQSEPILIEGRVIRYAKYPADFSAIQPIGCGVELPLFTVTDTQGRFAFPFKGVRVCGYRVFTGDFVYEVPPPGGDLIVLADAASFEVLSPGPITVRVRVTCHGKGVGDTNIEAEWYEREHGPSHCGNAPPTPIGFTDRHGIFEFRSYDSSVDLYANRAGLGGDSGTLYDAPTDDVEIELIWCADVKDW
jgi:hypothetical protein